MILRDDLFIVGAIIMAIGVAIAAAKKTPLKKIIFWGIAYCYLLAVIGVTLFPIPLIGSDMGYAISANFVPLKSIILMLKYSSLYTIVTQIGGNVLISVPYGFLLGVVIKKIKPAKFFAPAFAFPFVIEFSQLFIGMAIGYSYRSFDVDDFILNILGAYIGYFGGRVIRK